MKDLRVTVRLSNNQLRERREKLGFTQKEMVEASGVSQYSDLENLSTSPVTSTTICAEDDCPARAHLCRKHDQYGRPPRRGPMRWKLSAIAIADFFHTSCEELFPDVVLDLQKRVVDIRIDGEEIAALLEYTATVLPTIEDHVGHHELEETVKHALLALTPREEEIIRLCFGINKDGAEHTYKDIGDNKKLSRSRIQQIANKALRKLRSPKSSISVFNPHVDKAK